MLWAFATLAVAEMLLVHLFVTLRWPVVGWTLFGLSAVSILWLVHWIRSFRRHPHLLSGDELQLRTGSLRVLAVPLSAIERVSTHWESGEHKSRGAINVVPVAYPNRMIRLKAAIKTRKGECDRIALRVDDASTFDSAMERLGLSVR